jgi:hypothetical protein
MENFTFTINNKQYLPQFQAPNFPTLHYKPGHCATSRKVAGSIPDGVIEFFIYIIL